MHRCQTNMDRRPSWWWWMMIVRPADQHPSPLLNIDISAEPLDSLSERHVQVTKHPEDLAPPYKPQIIRSLLKELSPYSSLWGPYAGYYLSFFWWLYGAISLFIFYWAIIWAVLGNRLKFKAVLPNLIKCQEIFSHTSSMAPGMAMLVCQLVGPSFWSRLKYLNNYWMDCNEILRKH